MEDLNNESVTCAAGEPVLVSDDDPDTIQLVLKGHPLGDVNVSFPRVMHAHIVRISLKAICEDGFLEKVKIQYAERT